MKTFVNSVLFKLLSTDDHIFISPCMQLVHMTGWTRQVCMCVCVYTFLYVIACVSVCTCVHTVYICLCMYVLFVCVCVYRVTHVSVHPTSHKLNVIVNLVIHNCITFRAVKLDRITDQLTFFKFQ